MAEIQRLNGQVSELTEANGTLQATADGARSDLRGLKHKTKFKEVALAKGVNPKAFESFYRDSGYEPEGDEPDVDAITALVDGSRETLDYLFVPPAPVAGDGKAGPAKVDPVPPPKASVGKGGEPPRIQSGFKVTKAQTSDPAWMQANWAQYQKAGADGTLQIVD